MPQIRVAYRDRSAIEWTLKNVLLGSPISAPSREQLIVDALRLSAEASSGWIDIGTQRILVSMRGYRSPGRNRCWGARPRRPA